MKQRSAALAARRTVAVGLDADQGRPVLGFLTRVPPGVVDGVGQPVAEPLKR
jgi:hypothetical protein